MKSPYVYLRTRDDVLQHLLLGQSPDALLLDIVLVLIGLAAFTFGYMTQVGRLSLRPLRVFTRTEVGPARFAIVSTAILLLSTVSAYLFIKEMGVVLVGSEVAELSGKRFATLEGSAYPTALGYHRWGISLAMVLFCLAFAHAVRPGEKWRKLCGAVGLVAALITLGFAIFSSSRTDAAMIIVVAIIAAYYGRGTLRLDRVALAIAFCAAVMIVITVLRPAKDDASVDSISVVDTVADISVGGRHFFDLSKTSLIAHSVPELIPYKYGETLFSWAFAPVPRAMWLEKPAVGVGSMVGEKVYGLGPFSGVPPGFIAELYMNFHVFGVVLGMFIFGVGLRVFYESISPFLKARNPNAIALYALLVITCSYNLLNGDFSKIVVALLMDLLPFILIVLLVCVAPRRRSNRGDVALLRRI